MKKTWKMACGKWKIACEVLCTRSIKNAYYQFAFHWLIKIILMPLVHKTIMLSYEVLTL